MTVCAGGDDGVYATQPTFSGLIVYDVSAASGILERGRVAHPGPAGAYANVSCQNWWTNANSTVERSVFMDEYVYSVARDVMRIQHLNAMGSDVASVAFGPPL